MSKGGDNSGCFSIVLKFLLFFMNCVVLLLGVVLVVIGALVQTEKTFSQLSLSSVLSSPAIIVIVFGCILIVLGVCACIGALLEVYILLMIYGCILGFIAVLQLIALILFVVQKDVIEKGVRKSFDLYIEKYYNDLDVQNAVDLVQITLQCCGSVGPNNNVTQVPQAAPHSWEANPYFNCSSPAYQKCSVPYSCCVMDDKIGNTTSVINLQCGYGKLSGTSYLDGIYTTGCVEAVSILVTRGQNNHVIIGIISGFILVQVINAAIALSVARNTYQEKKLLKQIKKQQR